MIHNENRRIPWSPRHAARHSTRPGERLQYSISPLGWSPAGILR